MLSWFSTFGGAYSNLGEEFDNCVSSNLMPGVHLSPFSHSLSLPGGNGWKDIGSSDETGPATGRPLPYSSLQTVLQHCADPTRIHFPGQANSQVSIPVGQEGAGGRSKTDENVPWNLVQADLHETSSTAGEEAMEHAQEHK